MIRTKSLLNQLDMYGYSRMYLKEILESFGCQVTMKDESFPFYDLEVLAPDKVTLSTISVNPDVDFTNTGTVSVILSRMVNGKEVPVGLMQSKSEYFVFRVYGTAGAFSIETSQLMKLYEEKKYKEIRTNPNDPEMKVVVFDREVLLELCEKIVL